MKNNYWMKLWFDILRDPKMGMLPDRLWRRVIELFLIAGQYGEDGLLPDTATIAWQLNKPVGTVETDLAKIADVGILNRQDDGKWLVANFKKRNEPIANSERAKDFRMRNYDREFNGKQNAHRENFERKENVNRTLRSEEAEEQKNRRTELPPPLPSAREDLVGSIFKSYEHEIGIITPIIADDIKDVMGDYPLEWFGEAFKEAARNNKRNWRYALAILKRWKVDGFKADFRDNGQKPMKPQRAGLDSILDGAPIFAEDK